MRAIGSMPVKTGAWQWPRSNRTLPARCAKSLVPVGGDPEHMAQAAIHQGLSSWFARHTRAQLKRLAEQHDIPMHPLE